MTIRFANIAPSDVSSQSPMTTSSEERMGKSSPERTKCYPRLGDESSAKIAAFLRRRHPSKTAESVSAETGIPASTVKSWLRGIAKPGFDAVLMMVTVYETDFLAAVLPQRLGWLERAAREQRTATLEAEQIKIERELTRLRA